MDKQRTIKGRIKLEGVGLHTGEKSRIELIPALANTGIIFVRKDIPESALIKADLYSVLTTDEFPRRTSVGGGDVYIHTVEHLMAALCLLGINNLQINVWGEEIPGLDGSAKSFVEEIRRVGWENQEAPRRSLTIKEPVWVEENSSSSIVVLPYHTLRISYTLKYEDPLIGSSYIDLVLNGSLWGNLHEARTFCLEEEVKSLLDMGLGKGSNYENTLVVSKKGIVENKLRFPDEFVKHKILDLIGDLYLAGNIRGHVIAIRSGHSLNIKLLEQLRKYKEKVTRAGLRSQTFISETGELNTEEIMRILPHRYPFLLVDKIIYLQKGKRSVGIKNVTMNEYFFQGHFPGRPIMPGVLIVEAMAQIAGVLMLACEENKGKLAYFMAANNVKFRKPVEPGDQLLIEVTAGRIKSRTAAVYAKASVGESKVAEAELMFALVKA
ncbi:MAG: UDP-3-O-acyl-N-acetylglucosamine deacetylase [Candidatus Omnitrophota bacterium]